MSKYWQKRFLKLEDARAENAAKAAKDAARQLARAEREINDKIRSWYQRFADNNELSYADAKKYLREGELAEFKWDVQEYIKYGKENAIDGRWIKQMENASARVHISRLEAQELKIRAVLEETYGKLRKDTAAELEKQYTEAYKHSVIEIEKGTGITADFVTPDKRRIEAVLSKPWTTDGNTFSSRLWKDKNRLLNELHTELANTLIRGEAPDRLIRRISDRFGVSRSNAGRLVMTEAAYFGNVAQHDAFKELGVEMYEIVKTDDGDTCKHCVGMAGRTFKMSEWEVGTTAPIFHPNCRCVHAPYFEDEAEYAAARAEKAGAGEREDMTREGVKTDTKAGKAPLVVDADGEDIKTPTSRVTELKNFNEFREFVNKEWGAVVPDVVGTLNFDMVKKAASGVEKVFEDFPQLKETFTGFGVGVNARHPDAIMECRPPGFLFFNHKDFSIFDEGLAAHLPWIGAHEAGHMLEAFLIRKDPSIKPVDVGTAWNKQTISKSIVSQACRDVRGTPQGKGLTNKALQLKISDYAEASIYGEAETFAEAVAEYYIKQDGAQPLSKKIMEIVKGRLK